jgi:hypothetical protein
LVILNIGVPEFLGFHEMDLFLGYLVTQKPLRPMPSNPIKILTNEWPLSVAAGNSIACRRIFKNGKIRIENRSASIAKFNLLWLADLESYHGEKQMCFHLVPGASLDFPVPENQESKFLDCMILDLLHGEELTVFQIAPPELLN